MLFLVTAFVLVPITRAEGLIWLETLFVLVALLGGAFAIHTKGVLALLGLMCRPFPKLAVMHAQFENWLEFDLDWDETRR